MPSPEGLGGLAARFGLAGLANTALGLLVIAALDLGLGVNPHTANAIGYAVGVILSFQLNRAFVFRRKTPVLATGWRFLLAAAAAFVLNQLVLTAGGWLLGPGDLARLAAQAAGVGVYAVTLFLISRAWVFGHGAAA
jgi:putative flippase GtrA